MHAALVKVGEVPRDQLDRKLKLWADEVRELSYNMEDVVDKFFVRVDSDGIQQPHDNSGRFKELKNKMIGLFQKGKNHHRIADAVKEIKEKLQEVATRRDRNKVVVPNPTEPITIDPCLRALYAEATELVGIYGKRDQELMRLLSMEGDDASKNRLKKVSIVGFGGLGKITLARAVYEKIKGDFDCQAFVPVGQNPDMKKVLRDILIDLSNPHSDLAMLDANQLTKKLHEFLNNKRYLVIIDDIWDEKLWEGINFAFSGRNNLGSRLITLLIADAVKEIKEQPQEVAARRDRNKVVVSNPAEPVAIDPFLRALYIEATELVGIYGKQDQELMRLLSMVGDHASNKRLKKVSIVGFGGLGKTTLARAVYDKIKGDFDCQAFVPVGQNPDMKKVLRDILIDLGSSRSDLALLDANQLIKKLHEFLENKRYLVIIDDIWDEKLWESINFAFSNKNNLGSRLIITTRIVSVSNSCCSSADDSIYQMKPLSTDDS